MNIDKNFKFNHNGEKFSVKPPENSKILETKILDDTATQKENPVDLEEVFNSDELFSNFRKEISEKPRSFSLQEIGLILSHFRGKKIIAIMFDQFKNSGLHAEYMDQIVDNCLGESDYDLLAAALIKKQIALTPEQQQKFGVGAIEYFNVGAIVEHLDILQLSQEQKNSILNKNISATDLKMVVQYFDQLSFDDAHRSRLVDIAITNKNYREVLYSLKDLQPNAEQLNLLLSNILPRFWDDWKVIAYISSYDTSLLDIDKFETKVIETNQLSQYLLFYTEFGLTSDHMYDLCLASAEKAASSNGTYTLDKNTLGWVISKANEDKISLSLEKIRHLIKIQLENNGNLDVIFVYDYKFKLDATFLKDIKANDKFNPSVLRTKFDLSPEELKNYFEQNCRYGDPKYLRGVNMTLNIGTTGQRASETIFTQFNNEFIIMDEANRRNGGKLDPNMMIIAQAFGGTTDIEGYLLGRNILDGTDPETLAKLKTTGITETGEEGLDQLKQIFSEFKERLLKPEMTITELKDIREKLDIPIFQHYFVNFTRQTQGQFGNKTVDSLLNQMDYLLDYYEKTGVSDLEIAGKLKEGYQSQNIEINVKTKQEFPLNPEVAGQLNEYKANMESALELFKDAKVNEKPTYRLFRFVKAGKQLIDNLCSEAQKELDEFDRAKILAANDNRVADAEAMGDTKKVKINDPAKMLIGLEQKVKRMNELRTMVSAKTESGREYISPKIILDNWVQIFSELAKYKNNPEVKNYLQQMLFAEYVYFNGGLNKSGEWVGSEIDNIKVNLNNIELLNPSNPKISDLETTLEIVTHLINQEFLKQQIFEVLPSVIMDPEAYLSTDPAPFPHPVNIERILRPINRRYRANLNSLKSDLTEDKEIKKFESNQKLIVSRAVKDLDNILGLNAIKEFVDTANRHEKASGEKVAWNLQPVRGYQLEVSGMLCDACWADKYNSINESFPDITFVNISSKTEDSETKLEGGFMLMEINGENGEKVLTIRGLNPLMASIDNLVAESLVENIIEFTKATAQRIGAIPAIVIDDLTGGSCSNRPAIQTYCQSKLAPTLEKLSIVDDNKSNFNGYDISNSTYRLDKRLDKKPEVDKDQISD
jgi:hypothetical protein